MSELTVEKIKNTVGYVNSEEINFLLSHIKLVEGLLEVEQEDCQAVRKNKELNWQRAIVAESKLTTIERETAEKCAEIIGHVSDGASAMDEYCQVSDMQEAINNHFKTGTT